MLPMYSIALLDSSMPINIQKVLDLLIRLIDTNFEELGCIFASVGPVLIFCRPEILTIREREITHKAH